MQSGAYTESRFLIRAVFIALIVLAPVYYLIVRYGVEAWPTFTMPRFGGGASVPSHFALKEAVAVTEDGRRFDVAWEDLFGLPGGVARSVAALNFSPRATAPALTPVERLFSWLYDDYPFSHFARAREAAPHGNDPETRAWLRDYLAERYPGLAFVRVEFAWYAYDGFIRDTEVPIDARAETYVVDLE